MRREFKPEYNSRGYKRRTRSGNNSTDSNSKLEQEPLSGTTKRHRGREQSVANNCTEQKRNNSYKTEKNSPGK
jgi:hypothetical protein